MFFFLYYNFHFSDKIISEELDINTRHVMCDQKVVIQVVILSNYAPKKQL